MFKIMEDKALKDQYFWLTKKLLSNFIFIYTAYNHKIFYISKLYVFNYTKYLKNLNAIYKKIEINFATKNKFIS